MYLFYNYTITTVRGLNLTISTRARTSVHCLQLRSVKSFQNYPAFLCIHFREFHRYFAAGNARFVSKFSSLFFVKRQPAQPEPPSIHSSFRSCDGMTRVRSIRPPFPGGRFCFVDVSNSP